MINRGRASLRAAAKVKLTVIALLLAGCALPLQPKGTLELGDGSHVAWGAAVVETSSLNALQVICEKPDGQATSCQGMPAVTPGKAALEVGTAMGAMAAWLIPWGVATQGWLN